MQLNSGFTLVELLIVLLIIGILAIIAYPTFQSSAYKSRRADAKAALVKLALDEEDFRANCPHYADTLTGTRRCDPATGAYVLGYSSTQTQGGYYSLSIPSASTTGYLLYATATGPQLGDRECTTLSLDQDGTKGALDASNNPSPISCW